MIILLILVILLIGGGGGYWGGNRLGYGMPFGLGGILLVCLIIYLLGGFH